MFLSDVGSSYAIAQASRFLSVNASAARTWYDRPGSVVNRPPALLINGINEGPGASDRGCFAGRP
jgi:hypothetical protein